MAQPEVRESIFISILILLFFPLFPISSYLVLKPPLFLKAPHSASLFLWGITLHSHPYPQIKKQKQKQQGE